MSVFLSRSISYISAAFSKPFKLCKTVGKKRGLDLPHTRSGLENFDLKVMQV